jgi:hypothetical protein
MKNIKKYLNYLSFNKITDVGFFLLPLAFITFVILLIFGAVTGVKDVITSMIKTRSFRYGLWMLNLRKNCPFCGDKIITHGFEPDARYTCENMECRFNDR